MPASEAISTQNVYISRATDGSPDSASFTELAEVKSIGGPSETADEKETTHLRSPGSYREYIQTFKDGGEIPMVLNFVPGNATQQQLRTDFTAGTITGWRITYPDTTTCTFSAYVKAVGVPVAVDAVLELNATLRITGATDWDFA
jgi:hypothetical protein